MYPTFAPSRSDSRTRRSRSLVSNTPHIRGRSVAIQAITSFEPSDNPDVASPSANRRVALLACGDGSTRKAATRWLTSAGFELVTATAAAEALERFSEHQPGLVITDMVLRDERGRTLC